MNGYLSWNNLGIFPQGMYVERVLMGVLTRLRISWLTPEKSLICLFLVRRAGARIHPFLTQHQCKHISKKSTPNATCSLWVQPGRHSSTRGGIKAKIPKPVFGVLQGISGITPRITEDNLTMLQGTGVAGVGCEHPAKVVGLRRSCGFLENH